MRTYSKRHDLRNRLKLGVVFLIVAYIIRSLVSCSNPEPTPNFFIGHWEFTATDGKVEATFTLHESQLVTDIDINGDADFDYEFFEVSETRVGAFILIKNSPLEALGFYGLKPDTQGMAIDSVVYREGTEITTYYNQVLKKK
jgi:hypothetical protein